MQQLLFSLTLTSPDNARHTATGTRIGQAAKVLASLILLQEAWALMVMQQVVLHCSTALRRVSLALCFVDTMCWVTVAAGCLSLLSHVERAQYLNRVRLSSSEADNMCTCSCCHTFHQSGRTMQQHSTRIYYGEQDVGCATGVPAGPVPYK